MVGHPERYPLPKRVAHISLIASILMPLLLLLETPFNTSYPLEILPLTLFFVAIFVILYICSLKYPTNYTTSYIYLGVNFVVILLDWMNLGATEGIAPILFVSVGFMTPFISLPRKLYVGNLVFFGFTLFLLNLTFVFIDHFTTVATRSEVIKSVFETVLVGFFVILSSNLIVHSIYRDNAKIGQLNRELQERNRESTLQNMALEQINRNKDELFHIIAHDLRGPMGTISSSNELLLKNYHNLSESEREKILVALTEMSNHTFELLENLLQWSLNASGTSRIRIEEVNMGPFFDGIISLMRPQFDKKGVILRQLTMPVTLQTDRNALHTIIRNLLSNALKFTSRDKTVTLKSYATRNHFYIEVLDEGVGMSSEKVTSLFNAEKVQTMRGTDNEKGTGLGLQLCMQLVEKLNANLEITSEPGKGSCFTIALPLKKHQPEEMLPTE